jgi:hypothetical protein
MLLGISWSLVGCQTISHSIENAEVDKRPRFSDDTGRLRIVEESFSVDPLWKIGGAEKETEFSKESKPVEMPDPYSDTGKR